ncbi:DUF6973 domain-containing protein [Saccharothrix sp. Mg75]|uniref:DUF6973 domain-containing protein n=1 Tax=Saccharothrix sp. Mg75 TaxID=3445357 RepID=UPI003EE9AE41
MYFNDLWPWEFAQAYQAYEAADSGAKEENVFRGVGRPGELDNHRDAFRHAFWNAQLTSSLGEERAAQLTTPHEGVPDPGPADQLREAMDLHNRLVQQAVRDGRLVVIDDNDRLVPSDYDFRP